MFLVAKGILRESEVRKTIKSNKYKNCNYYVMMIHVEMKNIFLEYTWELCNF